jgi:phosphatidylglycerol lysyltransferase
MLASVLLIVGVAVFRLLGRPRPAASAATDTEISLAEDIGRRQQRADALLVLMRDKRILFSTSGRSFLMFGEHGGSRIALFDPFGEEADYPELVWQFRELCDRQRVRAAFYQVRPDHLPLYIDAGLTLTKLGEEARVPLQDFDLKDARHAKLRYALSRGGRDGLRFRMLPRNRVPEASSRLAAVSKAWLAMKSVSEKGFSLGAFTPEYVAKFDVATVLLREEIVAFATLLRTDVGMEATIDIMRHQADAPSLSMEFLVVSLILELKACGLEWFNLGMAPLSGLDRHRLAPLAHRLGAIVYEHGEQFYGFRGLRQFKEKFDPRWEPRYLASPGGMDPLIVLADVAALIGGGSLIDVVRK